MTPRVPFTQLMVYIHDFILVVIHTIIGHLLGHPGYLATSVFKDQYVRELRNHVLEYLDDRSRKQHTEAHLLTMMPH